MKILDTPKEFLDFSVKNYPSSNVKKNFEAYFFDNFTKSNFKSQYTYLPIQWTNYLVNKNYGKNIDDLKKFLSNNLSHTQKYFTVVQYAGGTIVELENTLIFSLGGAFNTKIPKSSKVIPMPLIYDSDLKPDEEMEKKYLASYIGRPTHKLREKLEKKLKNNNSLYIKNLESMKSEFTEKEQHRFQKIMSESYFSLCPRGYGPTSFRLYESLEMGVVPVYISDKHFLPFSEIVDWNDFSILLKPREITKLDKILRKNLKDNNYSILKQNLDEVTQKYFNFSYMCEYILDRVNKK